MTLDELRYKVLALTSLYQQAEKQHESRLFVKPSVTYDMVLIAKKELDQELQDCFYVVLKGGEYVLVPRL